MQKLVERERETESYFLYQIRHGCACSAAVIGAEIGIAMTYSNSSRDCCVPFSINTIAINIFSLSHPLRVRTD